MAFTPKNWIDGTTHETQGPSTTAISAAALEDLETRVTDYTDLRVGGGDAGVFNLKDYGAGGSGGNDSAAISSAITDAAVSGGIVYAPDGVFGWQGVLTIPVGVSIVGIGAPWTGTKGSTFKALDAAAQLFFENDTALNYGFTIDGNSTANNPWRVDQSFGITFISINVKSAVQDNLVVYDAQQTAFYGVNSTSAARDCLVLDGSAGSCLFSRCEFNDPGRHGIYIGDDNGQYGNGPGWNRFDQTLVEQQTGASDDPMILITRSGGGADVPMLFDSLQVVATGGTGTSVIEVNETASYGVSNVVFRDLRIGSATTARIGVLVDCDNWGSPAVQIRGNTQFQNCTAGVKAVVANTVHIFGALRNNKAPVAPVIDATSAGIRCFGAMSMYPSSDWQGFGAGVIASRSLFENTGGTLIWKDAAGSSQALY